MSALPFFIFEAYTVYGPKYANASYPTSIKVSRTFAMVGSWRNEPTRSVEQCSMEPGHGKPHPDPHDGIVPS